MSQSKRIFVVEDEAMIAMLLEDMLSDLGHTVVGVAYGLDTALELAPTVEADLAILDVSLGRDASFPVAQALGVRGVPFIFATGFGSQALQPPFQDAVTLAKPFEIRDLKQALMRLDEG